MKETKCNQPYSKRQTRAVRLTDLPYNVLERIAAYLTTNPPGALPLAESHAHFHEPVLSSLHHSKTFTRGDNTISRWACIIGLQARTLVFETPMPTDAAMTPAYPLLQSRALHTLTARADAALLTCLLDHTGLHALHLTVAHASVFHTLLTVLPTLHLHALHLRFSADHSLTHLPLSRRCACAPLRASPDCLVAACARVTTLALTCGCQAASDCTAPALPRLHTLKLGGHLPTSAPAHLVQLAPRLRALEFAHTVLNASALCADVAPHVTALCNDLVPAHRAYGHAQVERVLHAAPCLQRLHVVLQRDAEAALEGLPTTLRSLRVAFRFREAVAYADGVQLHTLGDGWLTWVVERCPRLDDVEIRSARVGAADLDAALRIAGARLTRLCVPVHAQRQRADVRLTRLFDGVRAHCAVLASLHVEGFPTCALSVLAKTLRDDAEAADRLRRRFDRLHRAMPFVDLSQVFGVVARITGGEW